MRFVKGHGTENDFVILPDPEGELELSGALVAAICDRRAGIGADGVLRVVRAKLSPEVADQAGEAEWFMDYRNADGSLAEMCGNGTRVFARYLVDAGLAEAGEFAVATRAGVRRVRLAETGDVTVDMGPPRMLGESRATVAGREYGGLRVDMGNPHLACVIGDPVAGLDLTRQPGFDPGVFPHGVNVELINAVGPRRIVMRVFERGSGETRSCGTGAVASAVAAARLAGESTGSWEVEVPGGTVTVTLDGKTSHLAGPAVLVASGELSF
ncbi:diaminopimelate epimerase [Planomonospora parontospora]|uniref:diaminopimelate epimerase n=1 Tax=Planomonospora parontospora TaxID=58119 RepID=UPI00167124D8|nr:diaminopimelate epimerase [Planomonospora parontospora]GGL22538.1 diaminopimelate epimerase [Planomonospora parontospora subsp. antibiotica]GII15654.1 diaminopimelate epimerase [Planomonospora parontospora subsp. antibiotica]